MGLTQQAGYPVVGLQALGERAGYTGVGLQALGEREAHFPNLYSGALGISSSPASRRTAPLGSLLGRENSADSQCSSKGLLAVATALTLFFLSLDVLVPKAPEADDDEEALKQLAEWVS